MRATAVLVVPLAAALLLWIVAVATDTPGPATGDALSPAQQQGSGHDDDAVGRREADQRSGTRTDDDRADGPVVVDFDGVCEVEVAADAQVEDLRPWQFPECERAPVAVSGAASSWIVVLASLSGDDFSEADALRRLEQDPDGRHLLWSSHYPSLNPDLWVVAAGPFADEDVATRTAERIGGYPRELSDDPDARYCATSDGCAGERRRP